MPIVPLDDSNLSALGVAAVEYARRGWAIFPCKPGSKHPATQHGCKDATTDQARIMAYWQRVPDANPAVATGPVSGIFVFDVDRLDSLIALEGQHGALPITLTQRTGGGGLQLFWRWPTDRVIRNSAGKLGAGLDVRGDGGYIVAPPSVHPDTGDEYVWLDHSLDCVIDAPGWLLDLLTSKPKPHADAGRRPGRVGHQPGIGGILHYVAQAQQGTRNEATFWAACKLRDDDVPQAHAERLLIGITAKIGLPDTEAQRTIASAYEGAK